MASDLVPIPEGLLNSVQNMAGAVARRLVGEELDAAGLTDEALGSEVYRTDLPVYGKRIYELQSRLERQVIEGGLLGRRVDVHAWEVPRASAEAYALVTSNKRWEAWGEEVWKAPAFRAAVRAALNPGFLDAMRAVEVMGGRGALLAMFPEIPERPKTEAELRDEREAAELFAAYWPKEGA